MTLTDHQLAEAETLACGVTDAISREADLPEIDVATFACWMLDLITEVRQARAFRATLVVMNRENTARLAELETEGGGGPRWASFDEAARYTGISVRTLRDWVAKGHLPAYRIGPKRVQIDLRDVDRLRRQVSPESVQP